MFLNHNRALLHCIRVLLHYNRVLSVVVFAFAGVVHHPAFLSDWIAWSCLVDCEVFDYVAWMHMLLLDSLIPSTVLQQ